MLPELTAEGELPPGVHIADWQEFEARFCSSSPRRVWLSGRLRILLEFAATGGKLRRLGSEMLDAIPELSPYSNPNEPFDLEMVLNLLDMDIKRQQAGPGKQKTEDLANRVRSFLKKRLSVSGVSLKAKSDATALCRNLFRPGDSIVTFNYDCLLESIPYQTKHVDALWRIRLRTWSRPPCGVWLDDTRQSEWHYCFEASRITELRTYSTDTKCRR